MTDQTIPTTRPVNLLPESPWAQHFYPSKDPHFRLLRDGVYHSGLAPALPYVSWDQVEQIPQGQVPEPPMKQLDVIFYSERYQRQKRHGMMSWRLPAMVSDLYDLSKRSDIEMDPNLIQVDEGAWLDCLKRSKWFDRQVDALSTIPNPHPDLLNYQNNWWTVDNPAIWRILRIALEMVNRVLNTIIDARHPWLDTVLFSQLQRWADIDPEMRAHCDNKQIQSPGVMVERPPEERATSAEMRAALDDALRFCVLSFSDEASVPQSASNYGYSAFGFTQEAADNIMKAEQGGIPAVIQALQSTRNPNNLPRHVKRPQAMGGNSDLADFEDLMDIDDLVDQAAAQTPGPGGSVMDAAAFAAAAAGPISEDEFKVDPIDTLLCVFHVAPLRCLLNTQSKPFERYNALMSVATTILHELSHCILHGRERQAGFRTTYQMADDDPYILPILGREAGMSFEATFFGSALDPMMLSGEDNEEYANGANTHLTYVNWPYYWTETDKLPEAWHWLLPTDYFFYAVPAVYSASLFSEGFWRGAVQRWGLTAFQAPKVLGTESKNYASHYLSRAFSQRLIKMEKAVPEMAGHYFSFRRRWQSLTTWNKTARPWWEEQYRKWSLSPWSEVCAREWIAQFREAHARRDLLECTKLIWKMINDIGEARYSNGFDPVLGPTMNLWGCIASLMMASIPVMAGEFSWKGPRPNIWWHPSMSAAVQWTKPLTLHPMVLDSYVKSNDNKPGPWTHPSEGLSAFWTRFCPMGTAYAIPHGWLLACYNTFQTLWANHHTAKVQGQWADFNFQIPEYDDQWAKLTVGTGVNVQYYNLPVCNWMSCHAPTGVEAAFYIPSPPSSPGSNNAAAPNSQTQTRSSTRQFRKSASQSRGKLLYPLHFSTGEVGNNMNDEDFWMIESDGDSGYDIFSISELCLQMGFPTAEMIRRELITLSPLGPKLREDGHPAADQIRGDLNQSGQKIGKLLLPRTVEYISEYDGRGGMPMWIIISTTVYDITRFAFGTQKEKAQLTENLGGRPNSLPDDPDVYDDLLQRLFPFRCALFEGRKAPKKTAAELLPFSPAMLSWHDNPTSGMYIAVDGIIYNIANYVDRHPGGRDILGQALGRAASNFHDFHAPDTMADYAELAVGRLVPDIALADLRDHQVAIHDWVFDFERLDTEDDAWVLPVLAHLCGKDGSEAIRNRDAIADALVHVYDRRKEAIVAHIAPGEVGEIPIGEVARHNDPHSFHGAWVMVDGYVFDVTTLMLHGNSIHGVELPHIWAGRELRDDRLRKWLQEDFPQRVIGRVVAGEARPEPTVEELLTSRMETEQDKARDELRRKIWGIEKDDEMCGGRIKFCGSRKRGCGRGRGAAPGWGPSKGRKRAATDADGGDATGPAAKRRG